MSFWLADLSPLLQQSITLPSEEVNSLWWVIWANITYPQRHCSTNIHRILYRFSVSYKFLSRQITKHKLKFWRESKPKLAFYLNLLFRFCQILPNSRKERVMDLKCNMYAQILVWVTAGLKMTRNQAWVSLAQSLASSADQDSSSLLGGRLATGASMTNGILGK